MTGNIHVDSLHDVLPSGALSAKGSGLTTSSSSGFSSLEECRQTEIVTGAIASNSKSEFVQRPHVVAPLKFIPGEVIEISSDEESNCCARRLPRQSEKPSTVAAGICDASTKSKKTSSVNLSPETSPTRTRRFAARRIVESSDSESSGPEVVVISDSSPGIKGHAKKSLKQHVAEIAQEEEPLFVEDDDFDDSDSDSAILNFNEPSSARRPMKIHGGPLRLESKALLPSTPAKRIGKTRPQSHNSVDTMHVSLAININTPIHSRFDILPDTPSTSSSRKPKQRQSRVTKKSQTEAALMQRREYAQSLFEELNRAVFKCGLPEQTKLNWNKRLLTTAGRARWHRTKQGIHNTEIELAEKILDCEERIRNTLSHEMCHLACWIIDGDPKEVHGHLFKRWSTRVMRKYPEIDITTRHNYDISYPYKWECENCAKIYGRFSRSIRPDECLCGACRVGKLVPLFTVAKRVPKTPKTSRMATDKPNDSPVSLPLLPLDLSGPSLGRGSKAKEREIFAVQEDSESDSHDSDVEILTTVLASVAIVD